jgi:hypothetical protein
MTGLQSKPGTGDYDAPFRNIIYEEIGPLSAMKYVLMVITYFLNLGVFGTNLGLI